MFKEKILLLIRENYFKKYKNIYCDAIVDRIKEELSILEKYDSFELLYEIYLFANELRKENIEYIFLSKFDAFFIAFLLDLVKVNPLPTHYICYDCNKVIFVDSYYSCLDMPEQNCDNCCKQMSSDGFNIPINLKIATFNKSSSVFYIDTNYNKFILEYLEKDPNINIVNDDEIIIQKNNLDLFVLYSNEFIISNYKLSNSFYETIKLISNSFNINENENIEDYELSREDLFLYLNEKYKNTELAVDITENVRKGRLHSETNYSFKDTNSIYNFINSNENEDIISKFAKIKYLCAKSFLCQVALYYKKTLVN